jgi:hypothetical protein
MRKLYSREQALILSVIHNHGMERIRVHQANHRKPNGGFLPPSSWLKANREKVSQHIQHLTSSSFIILFMQASGSLVSKYARLN